MEMKAKKLMILGAGVLQLPAILKAKEMGLRVIAVDMDPNAVGFREDGIEKEVISTIDTPKVLEAARRHEIDGIMTLASDMPIRTIAVVSRELGLKKGLSEETAKKATDKAAMREALAAGNVPIPCFFRVREFDEFLGAVAKLREEGLRCIVKPADNSGSRGVNLLREEEMDDAAGLRRAFEYSKTYSRSGELVVEEYMEGPEVSVETLTVDGVTHVIQITDKITTGAPYFVEMGHTQPSALPQAVQEDIRRVAVAGNRAIGITDGPSHTEIKATAGGAKIVELGARLGGDNITTHLTPLSTGVDMVECCIRIALGEPCNLMFGEEKASAIRYLRVDEGRIIRISGVEEAQTVPGIRQVSIVHGVGEESRLIRSSVDRIGFAIAQANSAEAAAAACDEALSRITVEVRP